MLISPLDRVTAAFQSRIRPPKKLTGSEWADEHFYLSAESSAEVGRWHTIAYQREPLNEMCNPTTSFVSMKKSARVGFTKMLNITIAFYAEHDPCPIMLVQPTIEDAEGYSKEEIAPMIRDCKVLGSIFDEPKAKSSSSTILMKKFIGGLLSMVGANSPRGFRRVSRKVVLFDETDGYPPTAGPEGDQIRLGIKRTEYYWDRKIVQGSTPLIAGASRIDQAYHQGDMRQYHVPCPHCGAEQVLKFSQFKWPEGKPELAAYECEHCFELIDHKFKRQMVNVGRWLAQRPFNGHASFHIWAAYSFSPNASWGQLATEFVEANAAGPAALQTFVNTVLGETWELRGDAPEWNRLYERRENYAIGTVPAGTGLLTCGVDVGKDRLIFEVVGWGRGKTSWSIDAGILVGDTAKSEVWELLEQVLARGYARADGAAMFIRCMAVDSGYNTQHVYSWCRRHAMPHVIAIKGTPNASILIGAPQQIDVKTSGKKFKRGGYKYWPVAGNVAKSELYGFLGLEKPTTESGDAYPAGYCHFPQYDEEFFKQLTAEHLLKVTDARGFVDYVWTRMAGRENHWLDARVYARAAAAVLGLDRMRDTDWDRLGAGAPPPKPVQTDPEQQEEPERGAARQRSGPRRREGWLKRRR